MRSSDQTGILLTETIPLRRVSRNIWDEHGVLFNVADLKHASSTAASHTFTFMNSTQYSEFRQEWREHYKRITAKIRSLKKERKDSNIHVQARAQSQKATMRFFAEIEMRRLEGAKDRWRSIKHLTTEDIK